MQLLKSRECDANMQWFKERTALRSSLRGEMVELKMMGPSEPLVVASDVHLEPTGSERG